MQTMVLCDKADKSLARDILMIYKSLNLQATALAVGSGWQNERVRLDQQLGTATHLVVIHSPTSARSSWLSFIAGYSLGSDIPLVVYNDKRKTPVPLYLAPFFIIGSPDELGAFLETESREWAAINERREARRELLELGVSCRGETFVESVVEGNLHAVELFLKAGLLPDTRDKRGVPLLCLAARENHRSVVSFLLEHGADVNLQSEDRGNSPLMDAVSKSNVDMVRDLIAAGADVNLLSKDGQSALVLAVGKNDVPLAKELLEAGADIDAADKLGFSARKYAKLFHDPAMTALFEKYAPAAS